MNLNSASSMPALVSSYCGVARYFSNSAAQLAASIGGIMPVTGRHSVIERPEPVSRVSPPTTIIATTSAKSTPSQIAMPRRLSRRTGTRGAAAGSAGLVATSSKMLRGLLMGPPAARLPLPAGPGKACARGQGGGFAWLERRACSAPTSAPAPLGQCAHHAVQGAHVAFGQGRAADQAVEAGEHPRPLGLGKEEPDVVQPRRQPRDQCIDLGPGGQPTIHDRQG